MKATELHLLEYLAYALFEAGELRKLEPLPPDECPAAITKIEEAWRNSGETRMAARVAARDFMSRLESAGIKVGTKSESKLLSALDHVITVPARAAYSLEIPQ